MHHEGPGSHRPSDKSVVTRTSALAPSNPRLWRFRKNGSQPLVQLGLHPTYPKPRHTGAWPRFTIIQRCLRPFQSLAHMTPLDLFAMWTAFPPSDYYGSSAPLPDHQLTSRLSVSTPNTRNGSGAPEWFPRSLCFDCRVRCPAISLRHRHGYAADFHRDLPDQQP